MPAANDQLRRDAIAIWRAGLEAVRSDRLVEQSVQVADRHLTLGERSLSLDDIRRIVVVGAGKAGAGMAAGFERALGDARMAEKHLTGWINVPADCVRSLRRIKLHAARPAGVNEPTEAGVEGAAAVLDLASSLGPEDLCVCLISGGGSALLPAPVDGITLADKQQITRFLSGAGANIQQLNTVRKQLSRIKGGGLARACGAGQLITLIISDVLGDPLDVIASGPTVPDPSTPSDALNVLEQFGAEQAGIAPEVFAYLRQAASRDTRPTAPSCRVDNFVIGNNATAVEAARRAAVHLGYEVWAEAATRLEGSAEDVGHRHARLGIEMRTGLSLITAYISGGEPTVQLADPAERGLGGRNQQLVLAALEVLRTSGGEADAEPLAKMAILSAGTDGEDGPTDAAGAVVDSAVIAQMQAAGLEPADSLRRNDAYHFFEATGGLFKTGPTDTNVCDIRVVLVDRDQR